MFANGPSSELPGCLLTHECLVMGGSIIHLLQMPNICVEGRIAFANVSLEHWHHKKMKSPMSRFDSIRSYFSVCPLTY
jgi:hypothetical protein